MNTEELFKHQISYLIKDFQVFNNTERARNTVRARLGDFFNHLQKQDPNFYFKVVCDESNNPEELDDSMMVHVFLRTQNFKIDLDYVVRIGPNNDHQVELLPKRVENMRCIL